MRYTNGSNNTEYDYPTYGRQFPGYRWYKPILVLIITVIVNVILSFALHFIAAALIGADVIDLLSARSGYDNLDSADTLHYILWLGSLALYIPALWIAARIVRDRPFSSYSSARGGWSNKMLRACMPAAFLTVGIPYIVIALIHHGPSNFRMRFTAAGLIAVLLIVPLQCMAEEYLFRGLVMQTLGSWIRVPAIAVLLQAVLFAAGHSYDMPGRVSMLLMGLTFGAAAWICGGLEAAFAYHLCLNYPIYLMQGFNLTTITSKSTIYDILFAALTGAAYIAALLLLKKKGKLL